MKNKTTCNYCHNQMTATIELEKYQVPVCTAPACPVFGLLQISMEKMDDYLKKEDSEPKKHKKDCPFIKHDQGVCNCNIK